METVSPKLEQGNKLVQGIDEILRNVLLIGFAMSIKLKSAT